jgi:NitT/TauT family transport system permease protein
MGSEATGIGLGSGWRRAEPVVLPLLTAVGFLGIWTLAVRLTGTKVFPSPPGVVRGLLELKHRGVLLPYIRDSLLRVGGGFGLAATMGIPLGLFLGQSPKTSRVIGPLIQLLRPISPLAWIPIAIVLFGVGSKAAVFLIFLSAFFPLVVSASSAIQAVPEIYLRAGRNFGLSPVALFARVTVPAALPQILVGVRVALGIAWLVVVAAEMIAIDSGLGYLIIDARNAGKRYDLVVAGILLIGIIGLILDLLVRRVERMRSVRWGFRETP